MATRAETNSPFIFWFVKEVLHVDAELLAVRLANDADVNCLPDRQGLYMIYLTDGKLSFPIYVGYTSRGFRTRFKEHATGGVINKVWTGQFPQNMPNKLSLYAILIDLSPVSSKLMESVLLSAFDFCLNREENAAVRLDLDTGPQSRPEDTKSHFDLCWDMIMKEVNTLFHRYNFHV